MRVPMVVREDDAAGARHGSRQCDDDPTFQDKPGDARATATGQRLRDGGPSSGLGFGVAERPAKNWPGGDRGRGRPQRRPGPVDQAANGAAGKPELARDLIMAGPVEDRAYERLALECGE